MLDLDGLQLQGQFFNIISECSTRIVRSVLVYFHKRGCNVRLVNVRLVNV